MARITVEDCLEKENNRFALVRLASKRAKAILGGEKTVVSSSNRAIVSALREIAAGKVKFKDTDESHNQAEHSNGSDNLGIKH